MDTLAERDSVKRENLEEGPIHVAMVSLDHELLAIQDRQKKYRNITIAIKDQLEGKLSEAIANKNDTYRFRCFWRRVDKDAEGRNETVVKGIENSTYAKAYDYLHELGIEKDIDDEEDDGVWSSEKNPYLYYMLPDKDVPLSEVRSFIVVYKRDPELLQKINDHKAKANSMPFEEYEHKLEEIRNDFARMSPRDSLLGGGVIEIEWR